MKMKKTTASLGVVLLFLMSLGTVPLSNVNYAAAQEVPALWARSYGGSSYDRANAAVVAPNGDVIVAGFTWSFGAGFLDAWVLRLDENGNVKWSKTYGGSGFDVAFAVAIAPNGDIIVAGETDSFGAGGGDVWVLRLDENGNIKWQKTYGGSDEDYAFAVSTAPNGDIILAGMSDSFGTGNGDFWVLRIDSEGNVKWSKTYGGSDFEVPYTVATVPNGDIVVAGFTWSFGAGRFDGWLLRLDENGNIKWQKTYGGSDGDSFGSVAIDSNGDIIVGGWTESLGTGNGDAWVLRLDENGNVKWQKTYGGSSYDGASAVVINKNTGDVVVAGYTEGFGAGGSDVWVLRLDSEGNVIWQKT
ncbi:MAG: hypothetical protein PWQ79_1852 [Thermococcaceae archaeon]|nr:hypothetical protein [Thermococcaceae archaeon]